MSFLGRGVGQEEAAMRLFFFQTLAALVWEQRTKEVQSFDPMFALQVGIGRLPADNGPRGHPSLPLHTAT